MPRTELTSHERFLRMFQHKEADRVPIIDGPWGATIERWQSEGMPADVSFVDFFGLDHVAGVGGDSGPRYPWEKVEETDEYIIQKTSWGVTLKDWKHKASVPQYLDFMIKDPDSWRAAKERMTPSDDRIDWNHLQTYYKGWREQGAWIQGNLWFGFDATHAFVDMPQVLQEMVERPEWFKEMVEHCLDMSLDILDRIWEKGYTFDSIFWCDDMGYKKAPFFSLRTYRELLKPAQKRAAEWAHAKGIPAHLHSCGYVEPFIPDLIEIGVNALNPLEVKAGMDPVKLKQLYGKDLVLHGGINAVLWDDVNAITAEMRQVVPALKENGGYIFSSDHSVPSSVSLDNFRAIVELAKELGSYE